jgi:hypothetical protein
MKNVARLSYRGFWSGRRVEVGPLDWSRALTIAWRLYRRRRVWWKLENMADEIL